MFDELIHYSWSVACALPSRIHGTRCSLTTAFTILVRSSFAFCDQLLQYCWAKAKRRDGDGAVKREYVEVGLIDLGSDGEDGDEDDRVAEGMVVRPVLAGEGIALGGEPCEFHRTELGYWFGR